MKDVHEFFECQSDTSEPPSFTKDKQWTEFICFVEDQWLRYRDQNDAIRAYFGSRKLAEEAFQWWKTEND